MTQDAIPADRKSLIENFGKALDQEENIAAAMPDSFRMKNAVLSRDTQERLIIRIHLW